jgi:hypothetical protein
VIDTAGIVLETAEDLDLSDAVDDPEKLKDILASLPNEVFGKWKM